MNSYSSLNNKKASNNTSTSKAHHKSGLTAREKSAVTLPANTKGLGRDWPVRGREATWYLQELQSVAIL